MAFGLNGILHMGNEALFASQAAIQTTGNNISNVNTVGYSRQTVQLNTRPGINSRPGQVGQGVQATQVVRQFDRFVESAYLDKATLQRRYEEEFSLMRNVETLFYENKDTPGIGSALSEMFKAWSDLAKNPESIPTRTALLETVRTLTTVLNNTDNTLKSIEEEMDGMISAEVDRANLLIQQISDLNREINAQTIPGHNNVNALLDERDRKVRDLAGILDIKVDDRGAGNYNITTGSGMMLVQSDIPFSLSFNGPRVENNLVRESAYDGTAGFIGKDGYEYTVEIVVPGSVDTTGSVPPAAGTAQYRVSIDGGKSWLQDENGGDKLFYATNEEHSTQVKDLQIYFNGSTGLTTGDKFLLTPKADVYWNSPTAGPIDISTQVYDDGTDNDLRITGGSLAGYLEFRDHRIGQYRDQLAALTDTIIWEVNRLHSQGSGLMPMSNMLGDYQVARPNVPLGSPTAGNHWSDRLQSGNMTFAVYDSTTGESVIPYPGIDVFSPENFDPSKHSLSDVVDAVNNGPASRYMTADIVDNRLQITSKPGYNFNVTSDTSGLAAALGFNTFFKGTNPADIGVRDELTYNPNMINAGRVNGAGEGNQGDNITAKEISELTSKLVEVKAGGKATVKQTMAGYLGTIVAKVGADTAGVKFTATTEGTMANELYARKEEISGVSLDEELSNLIRFQSSYKAAAKLITTADQMIQTILGLKQ